MNKVPQIAITTESDDNGSQKHLSVEDVHTDIEELGIEKSKKNCRKSRLKIKVANDGYATDIEDLEFSSADEEYKISPSPLPDNFFDLSGGVVEEIRQSDMTSRKSVLQEEIRSYELSMDNLDEGTTDIEDCSSEQENDEKEIDTYYFELHDFEHSYQEQVSEQVVANVNSTIFKKQKSRRQKHSHQILSDVDNNESDIACNRTVISPSVNIETLTDVEDISLTEEKSDILSMTILKNDLKQEKTDTESLESDTDLREKTQIDDDAINSLYFEKNFCAIQCTNKTEDEVYNWKEFVKVGETGKYDLMETDNLLTDEEALSDFDYYEQQNRAPTPNIQFFEAAVLCYKDRTKESNYLKNFSYVSDSEEVVVAGDTNLTALLPKLEDDCCTEVEDIDVENATDNISFKHTSKHFTTGRENFEISDNEYSKIEEQVTNLHRKKMVHQNVETKTTETEDVETSGEETLILSTAKRETPVKIHYDLDSMCSSKLHSEHLKKAILNTAEEQLHIKSGGLEEVCTDVEELSIPEADNKIYRKRLSVDLAEDKIIVTVKKMTSDVSLNWNNYTVKLGINSGEGNG